MINITDSEFYSKTTNKEPERTPIDGYELPEKSVFCKNCKFLVSLFMILMVGKCLNRVLIPKMFHMCALMKADTLIQLGSLKIKIKS